MNGISWWLVTITSLAADGWLRSLRGEQLPGGEAGRASGRDGLLGESRLIAGFREFRRYEDYKELMFSINELLSSQRGYNQPNLMRSVDEVVLDIRHWR